MSLQLKIVIFVHYCSVILCLFSPLPLLIYDPWYVSIPIIVWLVNLAFAPPSQCPLTVYENKLRFKQGLRPINGFISYHILKPLKKFK